VIFAIAILMIAVTSTVHAGAMLLAFKAIRWSHAPQSWRVHRVTLVVHVMAFSGLLETVLWAFVYLRMGVIDGFRHALYFSIVTYTTLGYGDVTPGEGWELLAAFSSINGIIMFGWSTAVVFAAFQHIFFPQGLAQAIDGSEPDS
jgi:hypothetical protein